MKSNDRLQALTLLTTLLKKQTPLTHLLQRAQPLSPLTKELCFGVCRHYIRLEALADALVTKRPKSTDVWLCLLLGLYQLHYLSIPDYAAVQETVGLLNAIKASWAKGLVNAVLRRYCREKTTLIDNLMTSPAFQFGHPTWFIERIQQAWPDHWQNLLIANDLHPPMSLRVNVQKRTRTDYLQALTTAGIEAEALAFSPQGIRVTTPCDVYELPGFAEGEVSVQDEAAQLAAQLLDLKPNLRLLDACCAPGGKTGHILETQPDLSACLALDIEAERLKRVDENLRRLGLNATLVAGDGLNPNAWWDGTPFDRILLDAPCSATGVIRRHPDIKLLRNADEIRAITQIQHDLLNALWPLLAPNGRLVYATCSVLPEENNQQIARFVTDHPDCQFVSRAYPWGLNLSHGWQILPGDHQMDGFFYSVLQKST